MGVGRDTLISSDNIPKLVWIFVGVFVTTGTRGVEMTFKMKLKPFEHQREEFEKTKSLSVWARFWEQGTGKSKTTIDEFANAYYDGDVDALIVVAPNGVHLNWENDELPAHLPDELIDKALILSYNGEKHQTKWHQKKCNELLKYEGMVILLMSYNAFMTKKTKAWMGGKEYIKKLLKKRKAFYVLDESHHIKAPGAKRTISIIASGNYAEWKRVLTGTPVAEGPFGAYAPIKFLIPNFWHKHGMGTFAAYKQFFGVFMSREECERQRGFDPGRDGLFVEYKNLDILQKMLKSISSRVLKDEVLDLPEKLYSKIYHELNPEQAKAYRELEAEYSTIIKEDTAEEFLLEGRLAITRLLRLQQITCGYVPSESEEPVEMLGKYNPRLDAQLEDLEGFNHQGIIWARFTHDINQLMDALGKTAVRYDGQVNTEGREIAKQAFQRGDAQWLVINPECGSEGLTFNMAKTAWGYSNSFKLIKRLQIEDRLHRIGQEGLEVPEEFKGKTNKKSCVLYKDLIGIGTVDNKIVESLRNKYDIASQITGDKLKDWL